jgi:asparaginyl-tRNA synthetase
VAWGLDLQSEHERYLTEQHVGGPVVVVNYPKDIKAFYMRLNDDGRTVAAMDVLVPGVGEIIGGSQREERLDVLDARLAEMGLGDSLWWYRDLRRYGTVPMPGSASASSGWCSTSPAWRTFATRFRFRACPTMPDSE